MRTLVAYFSQTGNTKKVAEAIFDVLPEEKEIKALEELADLGDNDLVFFGLPIQAGGPAKDAKEFLEANAGGNRIALFVTHGAPEGAERVAPWLEECRRIAGEADIVGLFDCQGEVAQPIIDFLLSSDNPELQQYGREAPEAAGQPDETRLARAREYAREIIEKVQD